jgi:hypothetical protein
MVQPTQEVEVVQTTTQLVIEEMAVLVEAVTQVISVMVI